MMCVNSESSCTCCKYFEPYGNDLSGYGVCLQDGTCDCSPSLCCPMFERDKKDGFFFIRYDSHSDWTVGHYENGLWTFLGTDIVVDDEFMRDSGWEIAEEIIKE